MKCHVVTAALIFSALGAYLAGFSLQCGILVGVGIFVELTYCVREIVNSVKTIAKK